MNTPRLLCRSPLSPAQAGATIELDESAGHHATRVLRLGVGDPVTLFDGGGGEYAATLVRADKRGAAARIDRYVAVERESTLDLTLAQAIVAVDAMDHAVRKAVELGAAAIQPLATARSAPFAAGERGGRRLAHWRSIAMAACEQCGRNRIPDVRGPQPLAEWMREWNGSGIVLAADGKPLAPGSERPPGSVALVVGPEGGWDARETTSFREQGFLPVCLGPRVLRTETATVAGVALLQWLWGDLR
jgi:16S rRNA (uracil1498-N3)-methyltransferase